ncbi:unnamed protein product, partial [Symbiodinium sp. KB8]
TVGLYFAPAIDPNLSREGVVYIGYSSRIIALSPQSGKVLGMLDRNKTTDPFVSSPTLSSDGSALFIHSAAGLIFKVLISGNYSRSTDIGNIDMSFDWCCLYSEFDQDCFFHKRNGSHELDFCSYEVWEAKAAEKGQPLPFRRYDSSAIGSPYPYATPALYPDDKTLVVTQYGEGAGAGVYAIAQFLDPYGNTTRMGTSRSSVAIDMVGNVYAASNVMDGELNFPALFALNSSLGLRWQARLGLDGVSLGGQSPLVSNDSTGTGLNGQTIITTVAGVWSLTNGYRIMPMHFLFLWA